MSNNVEGILNIGIGECGYSWSVRTYNSLRRAGIDTIGDMYSIPYVELKKVRGLGSVGLHEVVACKNYVDENYPNIQSLSKVNLNSVLSSLDMTKRTYDVLTSIGLVSIKDLHCTDIKDVAVCDGVGIGILDEVVKLKEYIHKSLLSQ